MEAEEQILTELLSNGEVYAVMVQALPLGDSSCKSVGKKTVSLHHCRCSCKLLLCQNSKANFFLQKKYFEYWTFNSSSPSPLRERK